MNLFKVGLTTLVVGIGCTVLPSLTGHAQATSWHVGTPKVLRKTWYHNGPAEQHAYITYTAHRSIGNNFQSTDNQTFYRLPGYGLKQLKYRRLSARVYQLTGIQYSPKGTRVQFDGQRLTYRVKVVSSHQLHFYRGYAKYVTTPTFKIVSAHHALIPNK